MTSCSLSIRIERWPLALSLDEAQVYLTEPVAEDLGLVTLPGLSPEERLDLGERRES